METNQGKPRKPRPEEIKKWLKEDTTKYLLGSLARKLNELDTVRDLGSDNHIEKLADKKAIEVVEGLFMDVYHQLPELQQEVASKEFNIIGLLKSFEVNDF